MKPEISRRAFVKDTVVASAGTALALGAAGQQGSGAAEPPKPGSQNTLPKGKIGDMEVSRILLGGNLLTHFTHSRDLR
jgi:hypothetical protein